MSAQRRSLLTAKHRSAYNISTALISIKHSAIHETRKNYSHSTRNCAGFFQTRVLAIKSQSILIRITRSTESLRGKCFIIKIYWRIVQPRWIHILQYLTLLSFYICTVVHIKCTIFLAKSAVFVSRTDLISAIYSRATRNRIKFKKFTDCKGGNKFNTHFSCSNLSNIIFVLLQHKRNM